MNSEHYDDPTADIAISRAEKRNDGRSGSSGDIRYGSSCSRKRWSKSPKSAVCVLK